MVSWRLGIKKLDFTSKEWFRSQGKRKIRDTQSINRDDFVLIHIARVV